MTAVAAETVLPPPPARAGAVLRHGDRFAAPEEHGAAPGFAGKLAEAMQPAGPGLAPPAVPPAATASGAAPIEPEIAAPVAPLAPNRVVATPAPAGLTPPEPVTSAKGAPSRMDDAKPPTAAVPAGSDPAPAVALVMPPVPTQPVAAPIPPAADALPTGPSAPAAIAGGAAPAKSVEARAAPEPVAGQAAPSAAETPHHFPLADAAPEMAAPVPASVLPVLIPAMSVAPGPPPHVAASPPAAPASPEPPSPAVQMSAALVQIAPAPGGIQRITVRLDPVELGALNVRIERKRDGPAQVTIEVSRPETLALIRQDQPALHRALDAAGLPAEGRIVVLQQAPPENGRSSGTGPGGGSGGSAHGGAGGGPGSGSSQPGEQQQGRTPRSTAWLRAGLDITA